jgi:hypothetical protein
MPDLAGFCKRHRFAVRQARDAPTGAIDRMRSLADVLSCNNPTRSRPTGGSFRAAAKFIRDLASISTPLDRNGRAKLLHQAEQIELRSKAKGKRNGLLGQTGLAVLRVLVFKFANPKHGLCIPSYTAIMEVTGFCKQTVCKAIRALEACGILRAVRRLVRRPIERNGITEVRTVQGTNVYSFRLGGMVPITIVPADVKLAKSFPRPGVSMLALLTSESRKPAFPRRFAESTC